MDANLDNKSLKIIIFDDYKLFNQGLTALLSHHIPTCHVKTYESWPLSEIEQLKINNFDLILLEINLIPPSIRYEEIKRYTTKKPSIPICVFTRLSAASNLRSCFESGAHGFLHKSVTFQELKKAIDQIITGGTYLPPSLFEDIKTLDKKSKSELTSRQKEILNLLSQGLSNQQIAIKLDINIGTVKQHFHNIFKNIKAKNRVEALQIAIRDGYIS